MLAKRFGSNTTEMGIWFGNSKDFDDHFQIFIWSGWMSNLTQLREEHRQLQSIICRLSWVITEEVPPAVTVLFAIRQELASALIRHLMSEDWVLYPKLIANSDETVSRTAREFSEEMGGLAKEFKDHSERWGSFSIEADWQGYRREMAVILDALALRITRENEELYPLFEALPQLETLESDLLRPVPNSPGRSIQTSEGLAQPFTA